MGDTGPEMMNRETPRTQVWITLIHYSKYLYFYSYL